MTNALVVLGIVGLIALLAIALRAKPRFSIVVEHGEVTHRVGRVDPAFVDDCERICREAALSRCVIRGYRGPRGMRLDISGDVTDGIRQRFRNAAQFAKGM